MNIKLILLVMLAFLGLGTANAQIGIGTSSPDASAQLELQSSEKGFLPPRMDSDARDGIANPAEGLTIYNTNSKELEFFNGTSWLNFDGTVLATPVPKITSGACLGEPEVFTFEGLEYRPVESDGKCWLDRNLGASQVATSPTDAAAYGDLYQWGRGNDGHQDRTSSTTEGQSTSSSPGANFLTGDFNWYSGSNPDDLWKEDGTGVNNPCPTGFRVPTEQEWDTERISWSSNLNDSAGALASPLKLPMAGNRDIQGDDRYSGAYFAYWSSSVSGIDNAKSLDFGNRINLNISSVNRVEGRSMRCIKE